MDLAASNAFGMSPSYVPAYLGHSASELRVPLTLNTLLRRSSREIFFRGTL